MACVAVAQRFLPSNPESIASYHRHCSMLGHMGKYRTAATTATHAAQLFASKPMIAFDFLVAASGLYYGGWYYGRSWRTLARAGGILKALGPDDRATMSLPRFSGRVSDRNYAAACNCSSYFAGLTYPSVE
jgi:hypothetical protein